MSVHVWMLGDDVYGVGRTREEAEKQGLDQLAEWVGALDRVANAKGPTFTLSPEAIRMRATVYEYGMTSIQGQGSAEAADVALIKLLQGRGSSASIIHLPPTESNGHAIPVAEMVEGGVQG